MFPRFIVTNADKLFTVELVSLSIIRPSHQKTLKLRESSEEARSVRAGVGRVHLKKKNVVREILGLKPGTFTP